VCVFAHLGTVQLRMVCVCGPEWPWRGGEGGVFTMMVTIEVESSWTDGVVYWILGW